MKGTILENDASVKKKGHGSDGYRLERHTEVSIVKWFDNKSVHVASSCCAIAPVDQSQSWDGSTRSHVETDHTRVVYYFIDLAVNSAWLLYERDCKYFGRHLISLMHFKLDICRFLLGLEVVNSPRAGRPSASVPTKQKIKTSEAGMPSESECSDTAGHLSDTVETGRCRYGKCVRELAKFTALNVRIGCV